jgi:hypothetical protein
MGSFLAPRDTYLRQPPRRRRRRRWRRHRAQM